MRRDRRCLLISLGRKQTETYDNSHKNGTNAEYQSSEFHTILLASMEKNMILMVMKDMEPQRIPFMFFL